MISREAVNATLAQLRQIEPGRPPAAGGTWRGVQHAQLVAAVAQCGFEGGQARIALSRDGADLACSMPASVGRGWVGFVASNARRRKLHFFAGDEFAGVPFVIDDKGSDGRVHWTYSTSFSLKTVLEEVLGWWEEVKLDLQCVPAVMSSEPVGEREFRNLCFHLGRNKVLSWSDIGHMDSAWNRIMIRKGRDKTAWDVQMLFAGRNSGSHPMLQMDKLLEFHLVLTDKKSLVA